MQLEYKRQRSASSPKSKRGLKSSRGVQGLSFLSRRIVPESERRMRYGIYQERRSSRKIRELERREQDEKEEGKATWRRWDGRNDGLLCYYCCGGNSDPSIG